ncbi:MULTISPECIES: hypothetical protein [Bacillus]|uniref:hypothetical protein n=1 Tax=Bacillus TaxID=1386 RepID=UPI0029C30189|nr:hypothetical protein [Bacillus paranthracis]MDX6047615.1 hypothetical protein [Bacillus paranthracis]
MLYKLDTKAKDYTKVNRVTLSSFGWKELDLQELLSNHIQDLISASELMTIFNERPRQEEPDILALDRNGDLYIFELKRWSSHQENLLQVLRYGQLYGNSNYDELNEMFRKYRKNNDSETELYEIHKQYFDLSDSSRLSKEEFNRKQHFLVVTNGLDQKTVEAIAYWKKNGLNIDAIVYWVFEINGEYFIEFNMYSPIEGFLEYESNTYILNTNYSNNEQHTEDMLREHKAAAYYPGWREKIEKLQKGDTIFLYKSGTGIIAFGIATGKLEMQDCDGHHNYEYYMKLDKFKKLKKTFAASEMKAVANQGFNFRQTMFSISEESRDLLIKEIKKKYL